MPFNLGDEKIHNTNFTKGQEIAVNGIIEFIGEPFDKSKVAVGLTGAGGVGKTFVTKFIITHCKYSNSVISCGAPTHVACRVFANSTDTHVDTIQSIFGLRLDLNLEDFDPMHPQFNPKSSPKLENIKLLIIDESSMIPAKLVNYIYKICSESNIKIIFIGDPYQLAPINEKYSLAFKKCYKLYHLTEIVRQEKTNPTIGLLNLLREDIDAHRYSFLEYVNSKRNYSNFNEQGDGFTICNRQQFQEFINLHFSNEEYTKNIDMYRIIAYTNACVTNWNYYIRNTIISDSEKNIITKNDLIMSYETIVDDFLDIVINNSEEYIIHELVSYVDSTYDIKGFLVKFQLVHGGHITTPLFIIDHSDRYSIQRYYKIIQSLIAAASNATSATRATKWKEYYAFKKKYLLAVNILDKNKKLLVKRDIDYGFAITAHKSQGSTYDNVFVDLNDMVFNKNGVPYTNQDDLLRRMYVSCSRTRHHLFLCYG